MRALTVAAELLRAAAKLRLEREAAMRASAAMAVEKPVLSLFHGAVAANHPVPNNASARHDTHAPEGIEGPPILVALDMIERMAVSPTTIISTTTAVEDDFTDKEWLEAVERRVQADKEAAGNGRSC